MYEIILKVVIYMFVGLFGLCISSFLNVVIYRLPNNMNICKPASHCPKCKYELKWYDNIPILSYLFTFYNKSPIIILIFPNKYALIVKDRIYQA